jgi:hypothetical protein
MRPMPTALKLVAATFAFAVGVSACSTNPITGRSQLLGLVSEDEAISGSAQAYRQMMAELDKKKQIEHGASETESPRLRKVQEITDRLIAQAIKFRPDSGSWRWEVQVINDPKTVNAFCMAGGKMAIYSGMWEKLTATTAATWLATTAQTVWTTVTGGLSTAMEALNAVIAANPILFLVGLIAILVGAFILLWNNSAGFRDFFIGMWHGIQNVVGSVIDWIKGAWNGMIGFFSNLVGTIGGIFGGIGNAIKGGFKSAINFVIDMLNHVVDFFNKIIYGINVVSPFSDIPNIPHIPRMHTGGVVPGMPGTEVPIMAMAGEHVSTSSQGGGGATLRITGDGGLYEAIQYGLRTGGIQLVDQSGNRILVA